MKIVIASDIHREKRGLAQVLLRESDADSYLFAGDSGLPREDLSPFASVKGNCDPFLYPGRLKIKTPYGFLLIRHYPEACREELERMEDAGIRIFVHGHTHVRRFERRGSLYVVCPGSLEYPRDAFPPSYAVLEIDEAGVKAAFKEV